METQMWTYHIFIGVLLVGACLVTGKPTVPTWLWEPVAPSEGTCGSFKGNVSHEGYISTPKYPANYPDSLTCELIVYVPDNYMARIYFIDFALETSRDCWLDSLEVTQQDVYDYSFRIGSYCGREMPPLLVGYAPSIKLTFTSDRYVSARGFRARLEYLPLV